MLFARKVIPSQKICAYQYNTVQGPNILPSMLCATTLNGLTAGCVVSITIKIPLSFFSTSFLTPIEYEKRKGTKRLGDLGRWQALNVFQLKLWWWLWDLCLSIFTVRSPKVWSPFLPSVPCKMNIEVRSLKTSSIMWKTGIQLAVWTGSWHQHSSEDLTDSSREIIVGSGVVFYICYTIKIYFLF